MWEKDLPTVSFIIPTFNSEKILPECLSSIANQDYPKEKIEILVVDGGSTDSTLDIAKRFGARIIVREEYKFDQERRRSIGMLEAKNEILAYIDSDNIIPYSSWLREMVKPFLDNPDVVGTQTLLYGYDPSDTLMNRYFALFGVNDPIAYYFNKRDRISWLEYGSKWPLMGKAIDMGSYFIVRFEPEETPTLGCNGYLVRKALLSKAKSDPENFFHTDVNYDLITQGHNTFAIVKNHIYHKTSADFPTFIKKRVYYMLKYHLHNIDKRRYKLYDARKDTLKLIYFILISLTFVKPLYDSLRGYTQIHDIAWFLHPLLCFSTVVVYSLATIIGLIEKALNHINSGRNNRL